MLDGYHRLAGRKEGRKEGRSRPAAYGCGLPHSSPTTSRGASANVIGPLRGGFQRGC